MVRENFRESSKIPAGLGRLGHGGWDRWPLVVMGVLALGPQCAWAFCGDGILDPLEACDDGGNDSDDGCSSTCALEPNYLCVSEPSQCVFVGPEFECTRDAYIGIGQPSQLKRVTITETGFDLVNVGVASTTYNALGFDRGTGYLFAWNTGTSRNLIAIASDGAVRDLGTVTGPGGSPLSGNFYSGDVSRDGIFYFVAGDTSLWAVDLYARPLTASAVPLTANPGGADLAINPLDGHLYAAANGRLRVARVNPLTGEQTTLSYTGITVGSSDVFGAQWFDAGGRLYFYRNGDGSLFRLDLESAQAILLGTGPATNQNDGTRCAFGAVFELTTQEDLVSAGTEVHYEFFIGHTGYDPDDDLVLEPLTGLSITSTPAYSGVWSGGTVEYSFDGVNWSPTPPSGVSASFSGYGTNTLSITDLSLPATTGTLTGVRLFIRVPHRVSLSVPAGIVTSQAQLSGLPVELGTSLLSDDPATLLQDDPTAVEIGLVLDSDGDGLNDVDELLLGTDPYDDDSDDDGLSDSTELDRNTNPLDADSDEDGLSDGQEVAGTGPLTGVGPTDPLSTDTDGDGIFDGQEVGVSAPLPGGVSDGSGIAYEGTLEDEFRPDGDAGTSTTDPTDTDSDGDFLPDGLEDADLDGTRDATETDPTKPDTDDDGLSDSAEDVDRDGRLDDAETSPLLADSDGDGLSDTEERSLGTDGRVADTDADGLSDGLESAGITSPLDADSDDDGLLDGDEVHGTGLLTDIGPTDPNDPDSDDDGLLDGLEAGAVLPVPAGTSGNMGVPVGGTDDPSFVGDADVGITRTDPLDADSDDDGLTDAQEDFDGDGAVESSPDPLLSETSPMDADSDDDGLSDGAEDADLDLVVDPGETYPRWADSDGDGLSDGLEEGVAEGVPPGTSLSGLPFEGSHPDVFPTGDTDAGATITDPLDPDSDNDGLLDGQEDTNANGFIDGGETDPRDADSDEDGLADGVEDTDRDGNLDALETNPNQLDTDGDGLSDGLEQGGVVPSSGGSSEGRGLPYSGTEPPFGADDDPATTTDPLNSDSDADGLLDGDEDRNQSGRVDSDETDPNRADTDGGGVPDGTEVTRGTDPLDATDDALLVRGGTFFGCSTATSERGHRPSVGWTALLLAALALVRLRRSRSVRSPVLASVAALGLGLPASLQAQETPSSFDVQQLQPTVSTSTGFLGVTGGESLTRGATEIGLFFHHADDPLYVTRSNGIRIGSLVGGLGSLNVTAAYGVTQRFDLGLDIPILLYQTGDSISGVDVDASGARGGLGDVRVVPRLSVLGAPGTTGPHLGGLINLVLPTGNEAFFQGDAGLRVEPRLLFEQVGPSGLRLGANLGYLVRPRATLLNVDVDDVLTYGLAARIPLSSKVELLPELAGQVSLLSSSLGAEEVPLEARLAGRIRLPRSLSLTVGLGAGVVQGFGAPDWRLFLGLSRAQRPDVDPDRDAILGVTDRCPDLPEDFDQWEDDDGCPEDGSPASADQDGDGIPDVGDRCPRLPEDVDGFQDDDGCPDPDNDGDGIFDSSDGAPNEPEDKDTFQDQDGVPDPDNDGDGIPDLNDRCPGEPEIINGHNDSDGCPDESGLVKVGCDEITLNEKVHFETDSATIERRSFPLLDALAGAIQSEPRIKKLRIDGHTDSRGKDTYNLELSQRRAEAVRAYLIQKGVAASRIDAEGFGESRPIVPNDTEENMAQNRRVEARVVESDPCR